MCFCLCIDALGCCDRVFNHNRKVSQQPTSFIVTTIIAMPSSSANGLFVFTHGPKPLSKPHTDPNPIITRSFHVFDRDKYVLELEIREKEEAIRQQNTEVQVRLDVT